MITLQLVLLVSSALFCLGLAIVLLRRNAIIMLIGIEVMLAAANLNFIAFWRYGAEPGSLTGVVFALFSIAVAAAEAAVGLALILLVYRHFRTIDPGRLPVAHD
ncbi:MAG: NADH-quinone oxidoreductase subunit NuoK [Puniceicoccaceae bacterium]|nr:MAG: NADH-quinone oxidoreductase subunit NuoK [Puniceicoccaceae bacterium]